MPLTISVDEDGNVRDDIGDLEKTQSGGEASKRVSKEGTMSIPEFLKEHSSISGKDQLG